MILIYLKRAGLEVLIGYEVSAQHSEEQKDG